MPKFTKAPSNTDTPNGLTQTSVADTPVVTDEYKKAEASFDEFLAAANATPTPEGSPVQFTDVNQETLARLLKAEQDAGGPSRAGFGPDALGSTYSVAKIQQKQAEFERDGPVALVISDEWYGKLERGSPFEEAAQPYRDANPDKEFRWMSPRLLAKLGWRGWQAVEPTVECSGMVLGWMPQYVAGHRRKANEELVARQRRLKSSALDDAVAAAGRGAAIIGSQEINALK